MAQASEKSKQLAELVKRAEESRLLLSGAHARLSHTLDLPARIKSSVIGAPAKWLGGVLIAGFGASFLLRPEKKKSAAPIAAAKRERGFLLGLLGLAFTLSKPALKIYATKLLKDYLSRRMMTDGQGSHRAATTPPY